MREAIEDFKFHDLGVDHDESEVFRALRIEDRGDDGIDTNRFARAGSAGDEQVRHFGQVGDERGAGNVFA